MVKIQVLHLPTATRPTQSFPVCGVGVSASDSHPAQRPAHHMSLPH